MTEKRLTRATPQRITSGEPTFGKFFATFNLVGEKKGVLNVYIRLKYKKHYEIYERREFLTSAEAGRWLQKLEPTALMFVIDPYFK